MKTYVKKDRLTFHCPACRVEHSVNLSKGWSWNEDGENPTIEPGATYRGDAVQVTPEELVALASEAGSVEELAATLKGYTLPTTCTWTVEAGTIRYALQSSHGLAGGAAPLPELT